MVADSERTADGVVKEVRRVDPRDGEQLLEARPLSGFASVEGWQTALADLHDGVPEVAWLYDVVLMDTAEGVERTGELDYDVAGG